ncbi:MAG: leucine-rich repeat domain-containing protein [Lachnospiraceae bacterium]|nr:leucine-rich repeat domain-containing protein [Lachnospiraceae bacterium]
MKKIIAMISITAMLFNTIEVANYETAKAADVTKQNINTVSDGAIKQETESSESVGEGEKDTSNQDEDSWEDGEDTSIQVGDFIIHKEIYFVNNDEIKIIWYIEKYLGNSSKVIIPDELEGRKIEGIDQSAFENYTNLEEVQLPRTLKTIEKDAFKGCINLRKIELPETVENIGYSAFEKCEKLKKIYLPKALCAIEYSSFFDTNIEEFIIDKGNAFFTTVDGVLYNKKCTQLVMAPPKKSKLKLPKTVTKINSYAVWGNKALTDVALNTALTTIGERAFGECSALKKVKLPNALKKIGEAAFEGCSALEDVQITNAVTSIGKEAFKDCKKLKDVRISASVTSIGPAAFRGCSNIKTFKVNNKNKKYSENSGNLYNKNKTILCEVITNKKVVTLLKSVKEVEGYAFDVCGEKINKIKVAKGNKYFSVYDNALYDKKKTKLYFCPKNKKSLILPATFKKGNYLDLLDEVKLEKIQVKATNKLYSSYKGVLYNKGMTKLIYVPAKIKTVVLPKTLTSNISELIGKGVTSIKVDVGNQKFQAKDDILYNKELTKVLFCPKNKKEVVLPETVKTIGFESFYNCNIKRITFPENLKKIEQYAFENCRSLEYVKFLEKGIDIGTLAFMNCSHLKWIYVPKATSFDAAGVMYIFAGCNKFTDIYFSGTEEEWNKNWKDNEEDEDAFWIDYGETMAFDCDFDETVFERLSIHYEAKAPL